LLGISGKNFKDVMVMTLKKFWRISFLLVTFVLTLVHVPDLSLVEGASRVIYVPEDFASIQAAVNNATPGDTVFVHQGTYYENIVVSKSISLVGENKSTTIVDGRESGSVVLVSGVRVKISGFTLRNSGTGWPKSGIQIVNSYVNMISDNLITSNYIGILIDSSPGNTLAENNITDNVRYGVYIYKSWENTIRNNVILSNWAGLVLSSSYGNVFEGNLVKSSPNVGVSVSSSYNNTFYYNNFVNNMYQVSVYPEGYANVWDAGYPQGGNFWSDYGGSDIRSGPYQNKTGSDGIGDFPYIINPYNKDGYPHVREVVVFHDVAVKSVILSSSRVYTGQNLNINVTVANTGNYTETFSITVYYDTIAIDTKIVSNLAVGSELSLTFTWNTTGVQANLYTIKAEASEVPGEKDKGNNVLVGGAVKVRSYALSLLTLTGVTSCNQSGYPVTSFIVGAIGYFKVVANNTSNDPEVALITVNAFDASNATLGVVSFRSMIMPGESTFILGLPIPSTSNSGTATIYASAFTDWPSVGGVPYSGVSANFQIAK
jgi:parallel beta-helix repeat protein